MLKFAGLTIALLLAVAVTVVVFGMQSPQDLQVNSLRVIQWLEVPTADLTNRSAEPHKLLAVVGIQTATDLASFAHNSWYKGLYVRATLCQSGTKISEGFNLVYDRSGRVGFGADNHQISNMRNYHLYVALQSSNIPGFTRYDLLKNPEDVCLALVPEAPNFGSGPSTNVIRLSRTDLQNALAHRTEPRR